MNMFPLNRKISIKFYDTYETSIKFQLNFTELNIPSNSENEMQLPCNNLKLTNNIKTELIRCGGVYQVFISALHWQCTVPSTKVKPSRSRPKFQHPKSKYYPKSLKGHISKIIGDFTGNLSDRVLEEREPRH